MEVCLAADQSAERNGETVRLPLVEPVRWAEL